MAKTKKQVEPVQEEPVLAPQVEELINETVVPEQESAEPTSEPIQEEDEWKRFADETLAKQRALRKRN